MQPTRPRSREPLELVDGAGVVRVDRAEADEPLRVARDVLGDVVVRHDEPGGGRVEREHDRDVDVGERVAVVLVERAGRATTSGHASRASDANFSEMCSGYSPTCVWTSTIMRRMKITEIATLPVAVGGHAGRFGGGYSEGYAEDYKFAVIIVLVRTDEGLTGHRRGEPRPG